MFIFSFGFRELERVHLHFRGSDFPRSASQNGPTSTEVTIKVEKEYFI